MNSRLCIIAFICSSVVGSTFATELVAVNAGSSAIRTGNADGSGTMTTLLTGDGAWNRNGLAVDQPRGHVYWAETIESSAEVFLGRILRGNLDGSGTPVILFDSGNDGLGTVSGIAVDGSNGMVYWCDPTNNRIYRGNSDGSGSPSILFNSADGLQRPIGIAIDTISSLVYWTDNLANRISSGNLNGTGSPTVLFNSADGLVDPFAIALDLDDDIIYWSDIGPNEILSGNLDGSGSPTVLFDATDGLIQPLGLAIDTSQSKLFWSDNNASSKLFSGSIDGSGSPTILFDNSDGVFDPSGIGLVFPEDSDEDLLIDDVETNTGTFVDDSDTGTDPNNPDTDGDGVIDGTEVTLGTDPNDPFDFPTLPAAAPLALLAAFVIASIGVGGRAIVGRRHR